MFGANQTEIKRPTDLLVPEGSILYKIIDGGASFDQLVNILNAVLNP